MALRLARALSHRNYRLFFYGQSVSLVGTWITRVAVSWLVYRLTGSELLLGIVGFAGQIPTLLLGPLAGVIVDRHNRHRMLIWTQSASLVQSVLLAVLTLTHVITVPHLVLLQLLQGVINAFDTPARQTLVVEMVTNRPQPRFAWAGSCASWRVCGLRCGCPCCEQPYARSTSAGASLHRRTSTPAAPRDK